MHPQKTSLIKWQKLLLGLILLVSNITLAPLPLASWVLYWSQRAEKLSWSEIIKNHDGLTIIVLFFSSRHYQSWMRYTNASCFLLMIGILVLVEHFVGSNTNDALNPPQVVQSRQCCYQAIVVMRRMGASGCFWVAPYITLLALCLLSTLCVMNKLLF